METCTSTERLMLIKDVTEEDASLIRNIWKAKDGLAALELFRSKSDRADAYNPATADICGNLNAKRHLIDFILRTYGVEYLGTLKRTGEGVHYCNAGDSYSTTVIFIGDRLKVACWADYVERNLIHTPEQF